MSARTSGAGLALRQFTSSPAASAALAGIAIAVAVTAAYTPSAMRSLLDAGLEHAVGSLPATQRDLSASDFGGPQLGAPDVVGSTTMSAQAEQVFGQQAQTLEEIRQAMPPLVRDSTGTAQFTITFAAVASPPETLPAAGSGSNTMLGFDPWLESHISVVAGSLPTALSQDWPGEEPLEIVLSVPTADNMHWRIGETRSLPSTDGRPGSVTLAGIFEATDAADEFWTQTPQALRPNVNTSGLGPPIVYGVGFANAASWPLVASTPLWPTLHVWYPVAADGLGGNGADYVAAVREFTRVGVANGDLRVGGDGFFYRGPGDPIPTVHGLAFTSGIIPTIERENERATTTFSVVSMAVAGPIGVAIAVLVLAVRLLLLRRADAIAIASARGASRLRIRTTLAAEGLALGLPAAAIGAIVAPAYWPVAVVVGILPGMLLAVWPREVQRERTDLGRSGRLRWFSEVLVFVLAAAGVVLLLGRGIAPGAAVAFDPLLVATPLLLILATCVLVLRLYPLPLALLVLRTRRTPGLVSFLGAARGLRDQAAGLAPVLAMVVAVSIGVFSAVLLATTSNGVDEAARESVGADLSVRGSLLDEHSIDGVAGIALTVPVHGANDGSVSIGDDEVDTAVVVVDTAGLAAVQAGLRSGIHRDLSQRMHGAIPVLVSEKLGSLIDGVTDLQYGNEALVVVGTVPNENALTSRETWLLADAIFADPLAIADHDARLVLVEAAPGIDLEQLAADLAEASGATVTSSTGAARELRSNPSIHGLSFALVSAIAFVTLLCAIAVVLTLVLSARAREHLLRTLRALGLRRRSERAVVAWEILPVAAVALVVGELLGLALPWVVLAGVDLRQFTGGATQPALVVEPIVPLLAAAVFSTIVLLALAITTLRKNHDQA